MLSMTKLGNIYGQMMSTMDRDTTCSQTWRFLSKRAREPRSFYGFFAHSAIEWLAINKGKTHGDALKLLDRFLDAHLVHLPDDRMCLHVKHDGVELQPTAKGFAYIEEWFRGNLSNVTEAQKQSLMTALTSPYNSMELVRLERSLLSETPLLTTGLAMWLWLQMLGEKPSTFDGTFRTEDKQTLRRNPMSVFNANCIDVETMQQLTTDNSISVQTPYWTSAMIHPSSNSVMQYWDSRGMRLFKILEFERPLKSKFASTEQYTASLCFSGKAMWKWIMDCTTAEKSSEAAKIVRMFVDQRFVQSITDRILSSATYKDDMPAHISRLTIYRFTQRGIRLCAWNDSIDVMTVQPSNFDHDEENAIRWMLNGGPSASELADSRSWAWSFVEKSSPMGSDESFRQLVTLDLINVEPGLKIPFRRKLLEWHCEENLRYVEDSQLLLLLLKAKRSAKGTITRYRRLQSQVYDAALKLEQLYIQPGAPFQLNISHVLRDTFLSAVKDMKVKSLIDHIEGPVEEIQTECVFLLNTLVPKFLLEDDLRRLPLRSYVIGCYRDFRFKAVH